MASPKNEVPPVAAPVPEPEPVRIDPTLLASMQADLEALTKKNAELEKRAAGLSHLAGAPARPALIGAEAPPPIAIEGSVGFDVTAMEAESTRRNLAYQETVALVRDQVRIGRFSGVPSALAERNFHFVRVGLKGDNRAEAKAAILREKGYVPAPPGVRAIGKGYESDGDRAIIYCASAQAHANLLRDKAVRTRARIGRLHGKRQKEIEDSLRQSLPAGTDLHVALKIGSSTGGLNVLDGEIAAAMRDMPRS